MTEKLLPGTAVDIKESMRLQPGQVGFGTVLFQSVAHIAPALALIFALTVGVQYAGAALPLSTLLGFIGIMAVAFSVGQLARVLPAAGYYMTWTGRSIGPCYGFMAGWCVLMSEAIPMGGLYLIMGTTFGAFSSAPTPPSAFTGSSSTCCSSRAWPSCCTGGSGCPAWRQ